MNLSLKKMNTNASQQNFTKTLVTIYNKNSLNILNK